MVNNLDSDFVTFASIYCWPRKLPVHCQNAFGLTKPSIVSFFYLSSQRNKSPKMIKLNTKLAYNTQLTTNSYWWVLAETGKQSSPYNKSHNNFTINLILEPKECLTDWLVLSRKGRSKAQLILVKRRNSGDVC